MFASTACPWESQNNPPIRLLNQERFFFFPKQNVWEGWTGPQGARLPLSCLQLSILLLSLCGHRTAAPPLASHRVSGRNRNVKGRRCTPDESDPRWRANRDGPPRISAPAPWARITSRDHLSLQDRLRNGTHPYPPKNWGSVRQPDVFVTNIKHDRNRAYAEQKDTFSNISGA